MQNLKAVAILALFIFLFNTPESFGQDPSKLPVNKNSIYVEVLGSALYLYNISYDRLIYVRGNNKIAAALGFQYLPSHGPAENDNTISFSPQLNYLYGLTHHLETGIGMVHSILEPGTAVVLRLGYRYQPVEGGAFFKIGFTPILGMEFLGPVFPWGGIAMGWTLY